MRQRRRRNTLLLIHWIYQIHTQFPSKISLKERKPKPSHSLHSYRDTNKFPCLFSHILAPVQTPTCDLCGVIFHICLVIVQGQNPFFFFLDLICCSQNFLYIGFHDDKEYFFLSNLLAWWRNHFAVYICDFISLFFSEILVLISEFCPKFVERCDKVLSYIRVFVSRVWDTLRL